LNSASTPITPATLSYHIGADDLETMARLATGAATPAALAEALARVMTEPGLRERLMAGARVARRALPDWPTTSARFAAALRFVTA